MQPVRIQSNDAAEGYELHETAMRGEVAVDEDPAVVARRRLDAFWAWWYNVDDQTAPHVEWLV